MIADPARDMPVALRRLRLKRAAGEHPASHPSTASRSETLAYAGLGRRRLNHLETLLETVRDDGVEGDLVDCGAGRGGAAIFMRAFLEAHELHGARVWVADRFDGSGKHQRERRLQVPSPT